MANPFYSYADSARKTYGWASCHFSCAGSYTALGALLARQFALPRVILACASFAWLPLEVSGRTESSSAIVTFSRSRWTLPFLRLYLHLNYYPILFLIEGQFSHQIIIVKVREIFLLSSEDT